MIRLSQFPLLRNRIFALLASTTFIVAGICLFPCTVTAGSGGGVDGGCAFVTTINGQTSYQPCTGANLPMWYAASSPLFNSGDYPCGDYGNQNCGVEVGDPMNE
jgi:hypothetical protein